MNDLPIKCEEPNVKGEETGQFDLSSVPMAGMDLSQTIAPMASALAALRSTIGQPPGATNTEAHGMSASRDAVHRHEHNGFVDIHPTAPVLAPRGVATSTASIVNTSGDQFSHIEDGSLYNSSPAAPSRTHIRNNLKRTNANDESDDEGGPVRSSQERFKRKRGKLLHTQSEDNSDIRIGHHTADPLIPVFAKLKKLPGTKQCHVYSRHTDDMPKIFSNGKCWSDYVHTNSQVNLEDVALSSDIFPEYEDELQDMRIDRKRELVVRFLSAMVETSAEDPTEDIRALTPVHERTPIYNSVPPFIIGFHKEHLGIPVRAQLRLQSGGRIKAVLFRLDADDVSRSGIRLPRMSVHETKIKFLPEFVKPTMEETKAEILTRFVVKYNENEDEEVVPTAVTSRHSSQGRSKSSRRRLSIRSGRGASARRLHIELPIETVGDIDESLSALQAMGQKYLTSAVEYGEHVKKREFAALEKETLLAERENVITRRERTIEEEVSIGVEAALSAEKDSLEALKDEKSTMQKRIQELEAQIEQARTQPTSSNVAHAPVAKPRATTHSSPSSSLFLDLNGKTFSEAYRRIPEQSPNSGWYLEATAGTVVHHEGPLQGKKFSRNQVLQPIKGITVPGRLKDVTLRCGDVEYLHYEENGISKLVQNSESVVQHEGRYYVCWSYLREIEEPAFKF
ncbi:hypothetical protein BKA65DRAFT_31682 [Rhexocercosporidium sp. MPI-PUGE-AT-0058]|nr:hypothetical protein BKA65DRAFT_31682 [Rhexocercosporidium sp. MPI-PUGE-AT-0058]